MRLFECLHHFLGGFVRVAEVMTNVWYISVHSFFLEILYFVSISSILLPGLLILVLLLFKNKCFMKNIVEAQFSRLTYVFFILAEYFGIVYVLIVFCVF